MPNRDCLIKQRNKTKLTYRNFSSYRRKIKPDNLRRKVYGNFLKNKRKSHGGGLVDISDGRSIRIGTDGSQHRARNLRPGPPRAPGGRGQRRGSGESREVERVENAGSPPPTSVPFCRWASERSTCPTRLRIPTRSHDRPVAEGM